MRPIPEEMGAIGAALITKERFQRGKDERTFIGLDAMEDFSYRQEANAPCPFCMNHCKRTIVTFSNGKTWVTNNRCERGEVLGDPKTDAVKEKLREQKKQKAKVPNLFQTRKKLLFREYPYRLVERKKDVTIGLPRVLSYWENMPFWVYLLAGAGLSGSDLRSQHQEDL